MNLLLFGDFCPVRRAEEKLVRGENIFDSNLQALIEKADLTVANLECPITDNNDPLDKPPPHLKATTAISNGLKKTGLNAFSLANNHILDYKYEGLVSTCDVLDKNGILYFGIKSKKGDFKDLIFEHEGVKVGLLSYSNREFSIIDSSNKYGAYSIDVLDILADIKHLKQKVDHVIVLLHTGLHAFPLPTPPVRKLSRALITNGATIVSCQHSHICGAFEKYEDGYICYGQGSLVFDFNKPGSYWEDGLLLDCTLTKHSAEVQLTYIKQFGESPLVKLLSSDESQVLKEKIAPYNQALTDKKQYGQLWQKYVSKNKSLYYYNILLPYNRLLRYIFLKFNLQKYIPKKMKLIWLNLFRNPEHYQLIESMLKLDLNK